MATEKERIGHGHRPSIGHSFQAPIHQSSATAGGLNFPKLLIVRLTDGLDTFWQEWKQFFPDSLLDRMDFSSEHHILDIAKNLNAAMHEGLSKDAMASRAR